MQTSTVHRNLDTKLKIFGFELFDLLTVLIFSAVMNLLFGRTSLSFITVFVFPAILGAVIYFGKRGKPDNHLIHFVRYLMLPGAFSSGERPRNEEKMRRKMFFE